MKDKEKERASHTTEEESTASRSGHAKIVKMMSIEEATIAGEAGEGEAIAVTEIGAASGEGEDRSHPKALPARPAVHSPPHVVEVVKEKEKKKDKDLSHSHKGHSHDSFRLSSKKDKDKGSPKDRGSPKPKQSHRHSGTTSSSPSPTQTKANKRSSTIKEEDNHGVKFSVLHEENERGEVDENPSELPSSRGPVRRLSRTKSEGTKDAPPGKLSLSVGKKVKKNTKTLLSKKKSPRVDRSDRNSVGSANELVPGERNRERRHSLDAKSSKSIVSFREPSVPEDSIKVVERSVTTGHLLSKTPRGTNLPYSIRKKDKEKEKEKEKAKEPEQASTQTGKPHSPKPYDKSKSNTSDTLAIVDEKKMLKSRSSPNLRKKLSASQAAETQQIEKVEDRAPVHLHHKHLGREKLTGSGSSSSRHHHHHHVPTAHTPPPVVITLSLSESSD